MSAEVQKRRSAEGKIVNPSITKAILKEHGIRLTKRLGQHFLIDRNILEKEIGAARLTKNDTVVEVGPGIGTLTEALAEHAGRVVAIEFDDRFVRVLFDMLAAFKNVVIVREDALRVDYDKLLATAPAGGRAKLVANLPYNIATPIISHVLENVTSIEMMVVMVQKEVGRRLLALPGTKDYGFFTLKTHFFADAEQVAVVPRTVFLPPPKVDSMIVRLTRRPPAAVVSEPAEFFDFLRVCFSERRKSLGAILAGRVREVYGDAAADRAVAGIERLGIDRKRRPETLDLPGFAALFNIVRGS